MKQQRVEKGGKCPHCGRGSQASWRWPLSFLFFLGIAGFWFFSGEETSAIVLSQLKKIREGAVTEAYYSYTARSFQKATSLEEFRTFIEAHPTLNQFQRVDFKEEEEASGLIAVFGEIFSRTLPPQRFIWRLLREKGGWKILSIQTVVEEEESSSEEAMLQAVNSFLEEVRRRDFTRAYHFATESFRRDVSPLELAQFAREYPVITSFNAPDFEQFRVAQNEGVILFPLTSEEGVFSLEVGLAKEESQWKILGLNLTLPEESAEPLPPPPFFQKVSVDEGENLKPFDTLFFAAQVADKGEGGVVSLFLEHLPTGAKTELLQASFEEEESHLTFSFSPPEEGWPIGSYHATFTKGEEELALLPFEIGEL